MLYVVPDNLRQFAEGLIPRIDRWHQTEGRAPLGVGWAELRAQADAAWSCYREYVHGECAKNPALLVGEGRRRPLVGDVPGREDVEGLHAYQRAVLLPHEPELIHYASILLRACTIDCLPYAARLYGLARSDWGDALYYVVEYRLILFDAVMYAFGPHRVQTIGARKLFNDRIKNFAENLRAARGDTVSAGYTADDEAGPAEVEDARSAGLAGVDRREFVRRVIEYVQLCPPKGVAPGLAALVLEGTMQVGKSCGPLAEWLSRRTGRPFDTGEVRRVYRAVAGACQTFVSRESLQVQDL
jgi:hypothetical protein